MSVTFVQPTEKEFDDFIFGKVPSAKVADDPASNEKAYDLPLPADDLVIRVYSTVQGGKARGHGEDAIRCVVFNTERGVVVGGRKKTLRIETWRDNLGDKIDSLYRSWRDHDHGDCPECGRGVLVKREPGQGDDWSPFLACSEWDDGRGCEYTRWL